jgi:hypothetical protein
MKTFGPTDGRRQSHSGLITGFLSKQSHKTIKKVFPAVFWFDFSLLGQRPMMGPGSR